MLRSKTDYIFLSDFGNPQQKFRSIDWAKKKVNLILQLKTLWKIGFLKFFLAPPWKAASTRESNEQLGIIW